VDPGLPSRPSRAAPRRPRIAAWLPRAIALAVLLALALSALSVRAWDPGRLRLAAGRHGPLAMAAAADLEATMRAVEDADETTRLGAVNDFFNARLAYREDLDNWGQLDYWASPLEALARGAGDCEDYAVAKYFTLVALGIPDARLRLVYARANIAGAPGRTTAHLVLAYYDHPDAEPMLLDNLDPAIRAAGARVDLAPIFSFNAEGLWQGIGSIRAQGDPLVRLWRWREVLERAREDGFE
jgi:predicted transglutaminase-like cysteine proteinase